MQSYKLESCVRGCFAPTGPREEPQVPGRGRPGEGRDAAVSQRPDLQPGGLPGQAAATALHPTAVCRRCVVVLKSCRFLDRTQQSSNGLRKGIREYEGDSS